MKTIWSILIGCAVVAVGLAGIVAPTDLGTIAQNATTPIGIYVVALVRIIAGVTLIRVAREGRLPIVLQVIGTLIVVGGLAGAVIGFDRNDAIVNWIVGQGPQTFRMLSAGAMAIGALIVYAGTV